MSAPVFCIYIFIKGPIGPPVKLRYYCRIKIAENVPILPHAIGPKKFGVMSYTPNDFYKIQIAKKVWIFPLFKKIMHIYFILFSFPKISKIVEQQK